MNIPKLDVKNTTAADTSVSLVGQQKGKQAAIRPFSLKFYTFILDIIKSKSKFHTVNQEPVSISHFSNITSELGRSDVICQI